MRSPSPYAQSELVALLLDADFAPADMQALLRSLGHTDIANDIVWNGGFRQALSNAVDKLVARDFFGNTEFLDELEGKRPGRSADFKRIRILMELEAHPNPLLSKTELESLKTAAREAGLHEGLPHSKLQYNLPADVRRRASKSLNNPDQLEAWFDAANRQDVGPGDDIWMVELLNQAVQHGQGPALQTLEAGRNRVRLTLGHDVHVAMLTSDENARLEKIVKQFGIVTEAAPFATRMLQALGRVCIIKVAGIDTGTGFLVGNDLILTNYHNIMEAIAGNVGPEMIQFVFDYRTKNQPAGQNTVAGLNQQGSSDANPMPWLIDASPPTDEERDQTLAGPDITKATDEKFLDFALIRIDKNLGSENSPERVPRGYFAINTSGADFAFDRGTALIVVGHPQGDMGLAALPQTYAIEPDSVIQVNPNGTRVQYRTNTMRGSSGSPVFNIQWQLVAIHHLGKTLAYNQGIPIQAIAKRERVASLLRVE